MMWCASRTGVCAAALLCTLCLAQTSDWRAKAESKKHFDNRYEGRTRETQNDSGPDLRLVNFTGYFQSYGGKATLSVAFYLPSQGVAAYVQALDLDDSVGYRMESKPRSWNPSWNTFTPWTTEDFIDQFGIRPSNLGVVVRLGSPSDSSSDFAPALLYYSAPPTQIDSYRISLRCGKTSLENLKWTLFRSDDPKEASVQGDAIPDQARYQEFKLPELTTANLREGPYRVRISGKRSTGGDVVYEMSFFHKQPRKGS